MKTNNLILSVLFLVVPAGISAMEKAEIEKSLSLQDCKTMALQNAYAVKNARLDVLSARARKQEALAEWFPTVSVGGFGFRASDPILEIGVKDILGDNTLGNNIQNIINEVAPLFGVSPVYSALKYGYTAGVTIRQPVYVGGRILNGNRLASIGIKAAELQQNISLRENADEIERDYWQVVALEEKYGTLQQLKEFVDTLYKDVASAVSAGLAVETDLMQVALKRNELHSGMLQLSGGIRLAKMNLFNSIGQEYCLVPAVADSLRPYIDDIVLEDRLDELREPWNYYVPEEDIAADMDETKLLELSVEAKQIEKRMTLGEALPAIGIGASYGYSKAIGERFNGAVYAMVQIPVSDWGKVSRKVQRQDYLLQKARNDRDNLSSRLLLQVRQLWLNLTTAWEQMQVAQESVDVAQAAVDSFAAHYCAGLIPLSELLDAQSRLRSASEALLDARIAYTSALTAYQSRK